MGAFGRGARSARSSPFRYWRVVDYPSAAVLAVVPQRRHKGKVVPCARGWVAGWLTGWLSLAVSAEGRTWAMPSSSKQSGLLSVLGDLFSRGLAASLPTIRAHLSVFHSDRNKIVARVCLCSTPRALLCIEQRIAQIPLVVACLRSSPGRSTGATTWFSTWTTPCPRCTETASIPAARTAPSGTGRGRGEGPRSRYPPPCSSSAGRRTDR